MFFVAFVISTTLIYEFEERFDKDVWRSERTKRHKMVDDIIDEELLKGKTKEQVISLLGKPSYNASVEANRYLYNIGIPNSFSKPKRKMLLVIFSNSKVISVKLTEE